MYITDVYVELSDWLCFHEALKKNVLMNVTDFKYNPCKLKNQQYYFKTFLACISNADLHVLE